MKSILQGILVVSLASSAMTACSNFRKTTDKWGWTDPVPTGLPAPGTKPVVPPPPPTAAELAAQAKAKRLEAPTSGPGIMLPANPNAPKPPPPPAASLTPEFNVPPPPKP